MAKLGEFIPQRRNANKHTPRGMDELESSVQTDGWIGAISAAADGEVFDGSARREVIETVLAEAEPIVIDIDGTRPVILRRTDIPTATDPRAVRLGLAANKIAADNLNWDAAVLDELRTENAALLDGLFRPEELDALLADLDVQQVEAPGLGGDEFDTTPQDGPTRTQVGDLWQLGRHRLLVGDCTDPANVARLMDGALADVGIFDPPYGMRLDASYANSDVNSHLSIKKSKGYAPVIGDHEDYDPTVILQMFSYLKESFWWGADYYRQFLPAGGSWIVWDKRAGMTDFEYTLSEFELCWSQVSHHRKILRVQWFGAFGTQTQDIKQRVHPTQKPIEVYQQIMERHSDVGALIVDTYLGSGSTLIAAARTGRTCYGCELSTQYADVILRRWEAETGQTAMKVDEVTA